MAVRKGQLRLLGDYLEGAQPTHTNEEGDREWNLHCPLHEDSTRSASINVDKGLFYCQAGCGGSTVAELIRQKHRWVPATRAASNGRAARGRGSSDGPPENITEGMVAGWRSQLMSNEPVLQELMDKRGLTEESIEKYEIGYIKDKRLYTIPVRGPDGELWNVRKYDMHPKDARRKIWGVKGMNTPRLYPISVLDDDPDEIIICGGEWDAMIMNQNYPDIPTITRTGTEDTWNGDWSELFADRIVYVGHDADDKGQTANRKLARLLTPAADVRLVALPYKLEKKHGKDWTDFWLDGHKPEDLARLLEAAEPHGKRKVVQDPETTTVLETFDARKHGDPVRVVVTVKGRKEPGYTVPKKVRMACTQDAGTICGICPMNAIHGEAVVDLEPDDPITLAMMDAPTKQVLDQIRQGFGAQKCSRIQYEVQEHQAVEVLFARPALDYSDGTKAGEYKNIKITSVGRHDTPPNNTIRFTGALYANPRSQTNEFLAWDRERMETSVDRFEITPQNVKLMQRFQAGKQRPIKKASEIARQLAAHVTRIHGRPEMHALMDLTFHSVLAFTFSGELIVRGWLDTLIIGDTRTGKSLAAERLVRHYGAGEVIGGEAASFAGIIGGLQQMSGKEWAVTWGVVPINDRRLVVLDEVSGLTQEEISQMSDVRSSGTAKLIKIQQEVTWARTRMLWLANPRGPNMTMSYFTYGVDAIRPLIGNTEDIARFDLAMAVSLFDVPAEVINQPYEIGELKYTPEACHQLLMWAWTRQPDQIVWARGAEDKVFQLANEMGARYVEDPPLVQAANIRIKIARVAISLAARTFSTDASHERIVVTADHVIDAVAFMDHLYGMQAFGYLERSTERLADRREAESNKREIEQYLKGRPTLAKYLRSTGKFRRQDLEEVLNESREQSNAIINTLWEARMVRKDLGDIRVEPTLHALLREVKW